MNKTAYVCQVRSQQQPVNVFLESEHMILPAQTKSLPTTILLPLHGSTCGSQHPVKNAKDFVGASCFTADMSLLVANSAF